jgi:hypothetical protein
MKRKWTPEEKNRVSNYDIDWTNEQDVVNRFNKEFGRNNSALKWRQIISRFRNELGIKVPTEKEILDNKIKELEAHLEQQKKQKDQLLLQIAEHNAKKLKIEAGVYKENIQLQKEIDSFKRNESTFQWKYEENKKLLEKADKCIKLFTSPAFLEIIRNINPDMSIESLFGFVKIVEDHVEYFSEKI